MGEDTFGECLGGGVMLGKKEGNRYTKNFLIYLSLVSLHNDPDPYFLSPTFLQE